MFNKLKQCLCPKEQYTFICCIASDHPREPDKLQREPDKQKVNSQLTMLTLCSKQGPEKKRLQIRPAAANKVFATVRIICILRIVKKKPHKYWTFRNRKVYIYRSQNTIYSGVPVIFRSLQDPYSLQTTQIYRYTPVPLTIPRFRLPPICPIENFSRIAFGCVEDHQGIFPLQIRDIEKI